MSGRDLYFQIRLAPPARINAATPDPMSAVRAKSCFIITPLDLAGKSTATGRASRNPGGFTPRGGFGAVHPVRPFRSIRLTLTTSVSLSDWLLARDFVCREGSAPDQLEFRSLRPRQGRVKAGR
jgi:hypothetical protein